MGARTIAGVALVAFSIACKEEATEPFTPLAADTFTSGSRLGARVIDGGDGARLFVGWQDRELDTACVFRVAEDGRLRCLPVAGANAYQTEFDIVYAEAACTTPRRAVPTGSALPRYIVGAPMPAGGCDFDARVFTVYELGEEVPEGEAFFRGYDGSCRSAGALGDTLRLHALGAKVDPARFVGASLTREPRRTPLAVEVLTSEDGARRIVSVIDLDRDQECEIWFAEERCTISRERVAYATNATDAECMHLAARILGPGVGCESPSISGVLAPVAPSCSAELFEAGARFTPSTLYSIRGGCTPLSAPVLESHLRDFVFFEVGARIDPSTFPSVQRARFGAGRVRIDAFTSKGDDPLLAIELYDQEQSFPCAPGTACDGAVRCVPGDVISSSSEGHFRDGACAEPVATWSVAPGCTRELPPVITYYNAAGCASESTEVWKRGGEYSGTIYFRDPNGACVDVPPEDRMNRRFFEHGERIAPEMLAPLVERVE